MRNRIYTKLKSRSGESLAETLVAVLVIALGSVMLASMVGAATKIATKSENTAARFYDASNRLEEYIPGSDDVPPSKLKASSGLTPIEVDGGNIAFKIDLNIGFVKIQNGTKIPGEGVGSLNLPVKVDDIKGAAFEFNSDTILSYGSDK